MIYTLVTLTIDIINPNFTLNAHVTKSISLTLCYINSDVSPKRNKLYEQHQQYFSSRRTR